MDAGWSCPRGINARQDKLASTRLVPLGSGSLRVWVSGLLRLLCHCLLIILNLNQTRG